ncbi:phosphopantetheine-binding protein, partial [Streptomyces monashensis]|uniref:phosphopantetheine-binding protein n=1 Tax=Streptomyces monashensis TaxID=1678012 RepID=UPI000AF649F5
LDAALAQPYAHLVPVRLDLTALQRQLDAGADVPVLLRGLLRPPRRRAAGTDAAAPAGLRERLLGMSDAERPVHLVQLVQREAATVLGVPEAGGVGTQQVFKELGMDSLMAVELRRRLSAETGLTLPSTLAFDYPTPTAIAQLLLDKLDVGEGGPARGAQRMTKTQIDSLVELLRAATPAQLEAQGLASGLLALRDGLAQSVGTTDESPEPEAELDTGSTDDLLQFLDRKLGVSR